LKIVVTDDDGNSMTATLQRAVRSWAHDHQLLMCSGAETIYLHPQQPSSPSPPASSQQIVPCLPIHLAGPHRTAPASQLTLLYSTQLYNNFQHYTISPAYSTGWQVCLPSRTEILTIPRALNGCFVLLWSRERDSDILKS